MRRSATAAVIGSVRPAPATVDSRPTYATSVTPTAPGVMGISDTSATIAIAVSTTAGGS